MARYHQVTLLSGFTVMSHCQGRAEEVILGDESHIILYEQGSLATVSHSCKSKVTNINGYMGIHAFC